MGNPADPSGFGKFVPGFDFLQKLAQGGGASMASWVAPTLDVQALDKRIEELKAVQFWLDQNAAALKATLQALEVQKMTLAALQNMNVNLPASGTSRPAAAPDAQAPARGARKSDAAPQPAAGKSAALPDPMQFWGALTQQFQQIASQAMQDLAARSTEAPAAATGREAAATPARKAATAKKTRSRPPKH